MNIWINDYVDEAGHDAGRLLSLSPRLHIILAGEGSNHKPLHRVGKTCPKCRKPIEGRNVFPTPDDLRVLGCDCLTVLFGAEVFTHDWILAHWGEWRRLKRDAETQLAAGRN